MIQIYNQDNVNYEKNGDCVLFPTRCDASFLMNEEWELELAHPVDDEGRCLHIVENAVLCVPTFVSEKSLYRIYSTVKADDEILAYARPIFMDSADEVMLLDTRPTLVNGQTALNQMCQGTKYRAVSDITKVSTAYYVRKNLIEAINGEMDQSFVNRWGGEIIYDNYTVHVNSRIGGDYGVNILYGKNLAYIDETVNMDGVVTRIIPKAYNGYLLEGDTPWVDSPIIGTYPKVYTKVVEFEDIKLTKDCKSGETGYDTLLDLRAALVEACEEMYREGCDKPKVNIVVEMVDLAQTEEYKDYKILEKVSLGDTVHCRHEKLGITSDARVIRVDYDCIRQVPNELELGDFTGNFISDMNSIISATSGAFDKSGNVIAERVSGILNAMNVQLSAQKSIAQKQDTRAILFEDTDQDSPTYGALAIGTQGLEIAYERTLDDRDWNWTTAITGKGIYGDAVITGLLSDKLGRNFWNLDTGELVLSSETKVGDKSLKDLLGTNLLLGAPDFDSQYYELLDVYKTVGIVDPDGTNNAIMVKAVPGATNAGIRTNVYNKPINKSGGYVLRFWAKANGIYNGLMVRFVNNIVRIYLTRQWKEYTIVFNVDDDTDLNKFSSQFQVGGGNTFSYSSLTEDELIEDESGEITNYGGERLEVYLYNARVTKEYSSEEILNILTDNGSIKGIYKIGNQLYISMDYILGGGMTLGGANNGDGTITIKNRNDQQVGYIDNTGIHFNQGSISLGSLFSVDNVGNVVANSFKSSSAEITGGKINITAKATGNYNDNIFISLTETNRPSTMGSSSASVEVRPGRVTNTLGNYISELNGDGFSIRNGNTSHCYYDPVLGFYSKGKGDFGSRVDIEGDLYVQGRMDIIGTKARAIHTSFGERELYAFESPTPYFADFGSGVIGESGECIVRISADYMESIEPTYSVYLQAIGEEHVFLSEKCDTYFIVKGKPGTAFDLQIMAPQKGYNYTRMEDTSEDELQKDSDDSWAVISDDAWYMEEDYEFA